MKVSKKFFNSAYIILCVVLLIGLFVGIKYIVELGEKLDNSNYEIKSNIKDGTNKTDNNKLITQRLSTSSNLFEINIPYGNVLITQTDKDPYVTFSNKRDIKIQSHEENGISKLKVITKNKFFGVSLNSDDFKINFYLPKEKLANLKINFDAGVLKVNELEADSFSLNMSAGSAVVKNCKFDTIRTDVEAGSLEMYVHEGTQNINSDVSAGNMNLLLPKSIKGFNINYDVELGNISNNLSFNIDDSGDGFGIDKNGSILYGDKSCKINLDLEIGNVSLNQY